MKNKIDAALNNHHSRYFAPTQLLIAAVTVISISGIVVETVSSLNNYHVLFAVIEWLTAIFFAFEYVARLTTSKNKLRYIISFWGLLDLISILPTFLSLANLTALKSVRVLRILRLMRIFRLAKISRAYLETHDEAKTERELTRMSTTIYFLALFSSVIALGSILYILEHTQKAYENIPMAMIQAAKIILGGLGQAPASTLAGDITIIVGRFIGLALFGLLISVVGKSLNGLLFGKDK
jgi:voltage-gated potassium channel